MDIYDQYLSDVSNRFPVEKHPDLSEGEVWCFLLDYLKEKADPVLNEIWELSRQNVLAFYALCKFKGDYNQFMKKFNIAHSNDVRTWRPIKAIQQHRI